MKLKIYLFRHGQTHYNKKHIFTGWMDSKLSPKGIKQAEIIAKKLKNKKFQIAYQSDQIRSKQTLKEVLKHHKNVKVITDKRIKERKYGRLEGRSKIKYSKEHPKVYPIYHRSYHIPPPGGESIKMVEKRVKPFIKDLLKKMKKEKVSVAISAHGNSMRPFRKYFEKLSSKQMMKLENPWDEYFEYTVEVK